MINLAASTQLCLIFCMTLNHRGILEAEYVVFTRFYILESEQILLVVYPPYLLCAA